MKVQTYLANHFEKFADERRLATCKTRFYSFSSFPFNLCKKWVVNTLWVRDLPTLFYYLLGLQLLCLTVLPCLLSVVIKMFPPFLSWPSIWPPITTKSWPQITHSPPQNLFPFILSPVMATATAKGFFWLLLSLSRYTRISWNKKGPSKLRLHVLIKWNCTKSSGYT